MIDGIDPELNVLEKPFEINKVELNEEFNLPKNKIFRDWYFNNFKDHLKLIKEEYFQFLHINGFQIYFFEWFEEYFLKPNQIYVIDKSFKWELSDRQIIKCNHPPLASLKQVHKNTEIKLSPFKFPNVEEKGTGLRKLLNKIILQINIYILSENNSIGWKMLSIMKLIKLHKSRKIFISLSLLRCLNNLVLNF